MKNALLIVNPHSGKKKGEQKSAYIREKLSARNIECTVFVSHKISDLVRFLKECPLHNYDFVGLVGGDGTMHEFLNAVLGRYDEVPLPVALFPCGTGNAFNFDIGCNTIDETLNNIFSNNISFVDIAEVHCGNGRLWSFNILGCGLVTDINRLAENLRWLGSWRYTTASLIKLMVNPTIQLKIKTEKGLFEERCSFVLACNTRYTGKGMLMAPHAQLNDGKFDVIIVKASSALKLLMLFPKIFKGKHLGADILSYFQTETLEVSSADEVQSTNIDGELKGQTPFSLKVHRNKMKVFVQQVNINLQQQTK